MAAILQFLNAYFLVLVPLALMTGIALLLFLRRAPRRWWIVWGGSTVWVVAILLSLRTSAASVSQFQANDAERRPTNTADQAQDTEAELLPGTPDVSDPQTPDEVRSAIASSTGKPTLVEFYTDYGIS